MAQLIVYTAIMGDIDGLRPPRAVPPGKTCQYVCFTDRSFEGRGWEIRPPVWHHPTNSRRTARYHKLMPHLLFPKSEITLWVDGCLTPIVDPWLIAKHLVQHDLVMFRHCERNCAYQELQACLKLRKDDPKLMRAQLAYYRQQGYPERRGLAETTAVLRRHTAKIIQFNELWWKELARWSLRDQLSVDYVCRQLGIQYGHFPGKRYECPYFHWMAHR